MKTVKIGAAEVESLIKDVYLKLSGAFQTHFLHFCIKKSLT